MDRIEKKVFVIFAGMCVSVMGLWFYGRGWLFP